MIRYDIPLSEYERLSRRSEILAYITGLLIDRRKNQPQTFSPSDEQYLAMIEEQVAQVSPGVLGLVIEPAGEGWIEQARRLA